MADDKVSGVVGLDPSEFKNGIAQMNRDLRVLESGFRASAASLGDWSDSATGLELRIKTLNNQMEVQQKKVAATRAEYERIKAEKGETSRAAQDLEIKLNKETETLGKMQAELNEDTQALDEMKQGEDEAGDAAENMGDSVEVSGEKINGMETILGALGAAIGVAVAALAALGAAAVAAVGAITDLILNAAEAGSALQDMSDKTGISTERLQELQFIGNQTGVSLDTITGAQARLIRSMSTAQEKQAKFNEEVAAGKDFSDDEIEARTTAFQKLGVSVTDSTGQLRNNQDVFADTIDALGRITNPTLRDALAMEIFGKSAQELNPLIKLGAAGMADMAQEAHDLGAVMSEEDVAALDAFDDMLTGLQDGLKGTLGTLATAFLPVAQELATVFQEQIMPAIRDFLALASQELEPVIKTIVSLIQQFASGDIRGGLARLFGTENADAIINLAHIVQDFIQNVLLPFFSSHQGDIQDTFQKIIGGVIAIATFVTQLAIAWTQAWFTMHDILEPVWNGFLRPLFQELFTWLADNIPAATHGLSDVWSNVLLPAFQVVWGFLAKSVFPLFEAVAAFVSAVFSLNMRVLAAIWQTFLLPALQAVWAFIDKNIMPIFQTLADFVASKLKPIFDSLASFINTKLLPAFRGIGDAIKGIIDWLTKMAEKINSLQLPDWLTPGSPTPFELGLVGISQALKEVNKEFSAMASLNVKANGGAGAGVSSNTQNDSFQFFAPVVLQGSTPTGSLGARLKGRRY
jgi:hypothetical protein